MFRCEFAPDDLCGLVQSGETDDFDWELHSGYTPSEPTGPRVDHTTGTEEGESGNNNINNKKNNTNN